MFGFHWTVYKPLLKPSLILDYLVLCNLIVYLPCSQARSFFPGGLPLFWSDVFQSSPRETVWGDQIPWLSQAISQR